MARGASGARRVELNRAAFDRIDLAVADGAFEWAKRVILEARVPDAPPIGQGLVQGGGVLAYVARKRVGIVTTGGQTSIKKPRAAKLNPAGITIIAGYGFPGRIVEEGTSRQAGQPFLTPSLMSHVGEAQGEIKKSVVKHRVVGKP